MKCILKVLNIRFTCKTKPVHYKFNIIINKDNTLHARKRILNENYVNTSIYTDICILFKEDLYYKINKFTT